MAGKLERKIFTTSFNWHDFLLFWYLFSSFVLPLAKEEKSTMVTNLKNYIWLCTMGYFPLFF